MSHDPCPTSELEAFVLCSATAPSDKDRVLLEQHLEHCSICQQHIERMAASTDDWSTARAALSTTDPLTLASLPPESKNPEAPSTSQTDSQSSIFQLMQLFAPSDDPASAGRLGAFEIVGVIGSGGMGVVLKAKEPALDRYVAIKLLAPHLATSRSARKRFAREARAAAAIIHENVMPIYQVGEWQSLPFLVMPYLPAPTLEQRLQADGPFTTEALLLVGTQIAKGLAAAHMQGLVHRDVKPANVLLSQGTERAVLTDFGLARAADDASLTRAGSLAGTPHYMSPEQARGQKVDQASDLFSLGSVLFALATGRPPIDLELGTEAIQQIGQGKVPALKSIRSQSPDWLDQLIAWLHAAHPKQRPESATHVAEILEQCLAHHRQPEKTALPAELHSDASKKKGVLTLVSLVVVLVAGFCLVSWWPTTNPSVPPGANCRLRVQAARLDKRLQLLR